VRCLFKKVCLGGTFSIFHKGHKKLLLKASQLSRRLIVGVTSDEYAKSLRKCHPVEAFEKRVEKIKKFLETLQVSFKIVKLHDPYGPAVYDEELEAIVVSSETLPTALKINQVRRKKGLRPLTIYVVEWVLAENGLRYSSTAIWRGLVATS